MKIVTFVLAVGMFLWLGGCSEDKDPLLGKWTAAIDDGMTITREFKDDGTVIETINWASLRTEGTYTTEDDKIIIAMTLLVAEETGERMPLPYEINWEFSHIIKGNKLILIDLNDGDGEEVTYIKE